MEGVQESTGFWDFGLDTFQKHDSGPVEAAAAVPEKPPAQKPKIPASPDVTR
jgi:hypothetical protein